MCVKMVIGGVGNRTNEFKVSGVLNRLNAGSVFRDI